MSKTLPLALLASLLVAPLALSQRATPSRTRPAATAAAADAPAATRRDDGPHAPFTELLSKFVEDGHVSYAGFQAEEAKLDRYLEYFAETDPAGLSRDEKLAFWINAYNAYTIKLILRKYPDIESIKDFWSPWDKQDWVVHGTKRSLNYMEHQVLRKMNEPRIHMAVNCASKSCPDLRAEAFVASRLDAQLTDAVENFLADPDKGMRVATEPGVVYGKNHNVYLSKILSWYGGDFGDSEAEILEALKPYMPEANRRFLEKHQGELTVRYMSYDWSLNGE